jgi:hypothetical protein
MIAFLCQRGCLKLLTGTKDRSAYATMDMEREPYTALSYSWGGDQPLKTTTNYYDSGNFDCHGNICQEPYKMQ